MEEGKDLFDVLNQTIKAIKTRLYILAFMVIELYGLGNMQLESAVPGIMWAAVLLISFYLIYSIRKKAIGLRSLKDELAKKEQLANEMAESILRKASADAGETRKNAQLNAEQINQTATREVSEKYSVVSDYDEKVRKLRREISDLEKELATMRDEVLIEAVNFTDLEGITSEEVKNKLVLLRNEQKELVSTKYKDEFIVDGTSTKGKGKAKLINDNVKQIIRSFNAECDYLITTITYKNIDSVRGKINRSFEALNKIFAVDNVEIPSQLLALKLEEARLVFSYQEKQAQEKEQQREIKAQMAEEEKVRREIEREKAKIAKEETHFKSEVDKLMQYLQKSQNDVERNLYADKIRELEAKIKLLETDKANVLQREQNTRAGFVYVISNIGSFGEGVYKIGMTRRLEPMDRVKELGDASVPFEFDVHAMIFSEDAPALENILHNTFRDREINKVNHRKEFFRVDLAEVEKVVKEKYNATVTFTMLAEAQQYRESLRLAEEGVIAEVVPEEEFIEELAEDDETTAEE